MPITRYQIRNEHSLADPELYRAADKDDPEALLEGVAMAGLVGLLRQLGDLSEFAAQIFHDLHEEVMVTAARGHGLMARVQQIEAEVPSLERTFLSQTHHLSFFSNGGFDWHPNLQSEHNLISHGDLPRFVMDSYEECRGPPRLFLLDKFDVAGAGACLKRYTDPSFFKMESASSGLATVEVNKEKKNRKIKKKGTRLRNGETPDVAPTHAKLHQLLLEERIEDACSDPTHLVKMKKRQLDGSAVEAKTGKSYMEKLLESPSVNHKMVCETSAYPHPVRLVSDDTSELGIKILEISSIRPEKRSLGNEMTRSWTNEEESELKHSSEMCGETDRDLVMVHEQVSACADEVSLNHHKAPEEKELAVDEQKKTESFLDGYHSDDVTSDVDNYLDALATMESELETDYDYRPKSSFLHIQKLTDSGNKEDQLQARFSYSQSFGDSSTSDEIASFKQYINEEHAELQARLSDSQSGTSFTSDENSSVKRDRIEEYSELQAKFSDFQYFQNSSTSDVNSSFNKDISCFSYSDSLSTVVENMQSEPILHQSTKYSKSEIEDINQLPQIVETQKTDCCEFLMHDDGTHDAEEEISGVREVFSGSYLMNSGHKLLYSHLGATSSMKLPTGTQSDKAPSGPVELQLRLADEDTKYKVESADAIPDALSSMNVDTSPAVSSEKYPLNNLNDGDQFVTYNPILKISNDLELASDECCNHSIKAFQAESPNENCSEILFSREIGTEGDHPICSFVEEVVDLYANTTLPLDSLVSKAVDDTIATQLNAEDLSSMVKTPSVCSFTRKQCSDLINGSPQDEPDSAGIEIKCYDWQSEFEEISKLEHGDEVSGSTCNVDADEDDSQLKDSSSADYRGQDCHVPVDDVVYTEIQSEEQAVSADTSENDLSVANCPASNMISSASRDLSNLQEPIPGSSCSHEIKMEPNWVESTKIYVDSHAEKMEYQLEPSSDFNMTSPMRNPTSLEESYSAFIDPHDKQMEVIKAVVRESFTDLETMKVMHQSDTACADVQLNLHRSVPCDDSEICNSIKDSSTKEQTKRISSVKDMKIVPAFSKLDTHESESISLWQKKLLPNSKDGLSSTSYNQVESGTHLEQFLQSQVGQQDAGFLLKDVKNSSSKKLQSEKTQISNHLEEERSSHAASNSAHEIHLDQPTSSESLPQSAGQEVNHTKRVINKPLPLLPERFTKGSEINFEKMPPMPPLPPMQWRTGKVQLASLASHKEVIEVSQTSFQSIQPIKSNEKAQYGLPTPGRETFQYQNPFLPVMAVESDKLQHTSGFSVGGHPVAIPLQLPIMLNEANGQYNYLVLDRSHIQTPILTLPVPLVSTSKPPHGHIVASEGETIKNSNPSPPMQPVEHANSGHDPISPQELCQPPSQLMTDSSLEVKTLQQSPSNLEQGDSSISSMSPPSTEYVQPPNHNQQPSEGEMASTLDTSALASDFESEKLDERPKNKLPRPRSPLIDAVAIPDKSKLRKVAERIRPQIAPKVEERDSFLEQIRQKSFNLKPPSPLRTRYHYQAPKTNLKVAAILEKANSIRQALAGSDEDDDVDSWSDS